MAVSRFSTSTVAKGLPKYQKVWDPNAIASGSLVSLQTVTVGSGGAASISFASIPQTYTHLHIRGIYRDTSSTTGDSALWIQYNGDTGSNYAWHRMWANSASTSAGASSSTTWGLLGVGAYGGNIANQFGATVADISDYTNTNKTKVSRSLTGDDANGYGYIGIHSTLWNNTSAVTSITIYPTSSYNFAQYSQFALYGVK